LCTLVGIILYIGSITGEVGNKPRASIEEPKFLYDYGSSFFMAVGSFVLTELSGVFSVYLYISKHKQSQRVKRLALKPEHNDRNHHQGAARHIRRAPRDNSRDRSQSRDRSREPSASRSESYFTYTPISDTTSHELSNYTFPRENTNNTISTTAELHAPRGLADNSTSFPYTTPTTAIAPPTSCVRSGSPPSVMGSIDIVRRTTPV
ncbi:voltage-dependent calcium channel gamma-2 subunit-like, partial [Aplysia californica]|uniref:Voltage-dependent calcium channel gamma-2 subunit-like n=1 Tax=Aplysia californica TaxID=6500 RepID=A0ABM0KA39_APLCA